MCHDKGNEDNPREVTPEYVNECRTIYKGNDCYPPGDDKSGCIGDAITYCKSQYVTCRPPEVTPEVDVPPPPEDDCSGLSDNNCEIKIQKCKKSAKRSKKCGKKCKKDKNQLKFKCQKTCCELGFPV